MTLSPAWRRSLLLIGLLWAAVLAGFWPVFEQMAGIWWHNDTFAHGMVVLPISLWLIWQQRERLSVETPERSLSPIVLLLGVGLFWLVGELSQVAVLRMWGAVGFLILAAVVALGWRVAWSIAFPLLFLLFAVPFGDFLIDPMMDQTADITIGALKLIGIPVFREGRSFQIPTGSWSVVEACSGLRYLIASVMLGVLFAYLTYQHWHKRLLFVLFAFAMPVIANWIRAFLIVLVGHLSENRYATGIDHIISGWVFFGIVIFAMFRVGVRFQDPPANAPVATPVSSKPSISTKNWAADLALTLTAILVWPFVVYPALQKADQGARTLAAPAIGAWSTPSTPAWQPVYAGDRERLAQVYVSGNERVDLFLAAYRQQAKYGSMVTYNNRLIDFWDVSKAQTVTQVISENWQGEAVQFEQHIMAADRFSKQKRVLWRLYQVGDTRALSPAKVKIATLFAQLKGQGDASAVLMLSTVDDDPERGIARLRAFLASDTGALKQSVIKAAQ
jgi:exosortase A